MNSNEQIIEEILQIKQQYQAQVSGAHKQWPKVIKERVQLLVEGGMKLRALAERTGISYHTISSWNYGKDKKPFKEIAVSGPPKMKSNLIKKSTPATVAKKSVTVTDTKKALTVKTPEGLLLSLSSVEEIILIVNEYRRNP
jgi:transposase